MSYINTLTDSAKKNINLIIDRLNANGITNPISQAGILAVVSKESSFKPQSEISYKNTANSRIRQIFGDRVKGLSESQLTSLKKNDVEFFDYVYGKRNPELALGNTLKGDGYKYRGRGFIQLTGKANYKKYAELTNTNILNDPDLLNKVNIAIDVLVAYYKRQFNSPNNKLKYYNTTGINNFKDLNNSTKAFYHATAGWGRSLKSLEADTTGGRKKALTRVKDLYALTKNPKFIYDNQKDTGKTNLLTLPLLIIGVGLYLIFK